MQSLSGRSRIIQSFLRCGHRLNKSTSKTFRNIDIRYKNWFYSGTICATTMSLYAYNICATDVSDSSSDSKAGSVLIYFRNYYDSIMEGEQVDKMKIDFELFELLALVANYNNPIIIQQLFREV